MDGRILEGNLWPTRYQTETVNSISPTDRRTNRKGKPDPENIYPYIHQLRPRRLGPNAATSGVRVQQLIYNSNKNNTILRELRFPPQNDVANRIRNQKSHLLSLRALAKIHTPKNSGYPGRNKKTNGQILRSG